MIKDKIPGIYLITNKLNNKKYVGKSKSIYDRWEQHCDSSLKRESNTYIHKAIRKYKPENFKIELIDDENSNEKEIYWIDKLKPEYNMTKGGDGGWINDQTGKRWKVKDTSKMKEANMKSLDKRKEIYIPKISGRNNYQCNYIIYTPYGIFETWLDATNKAKELRLGGNKNVITDGATLRKYCTNNTFLSPNGRRTPKERRGKYTLDLGFKIEYKKEIEND